MYVPEGLSGKESACNSGNLSSIPRLGRSPGEGNVNLLIFLPGKSHGQRNLVGYSPWGCKELDTTFTFTLVRYSLGLGLTTRAVLTESFIWALYINIFGNLCTLDSGKPNYSQVCVRLRCGSCYLFLIFLFLTFNVFITSMLESRPRQKKLGHYLRISGFLYLCNSLFCVLLHNF